MLGLQFFLKVLADRGRCRLGGSELCDAGTGERVGAVACATALTRAPECYDRLGSCWAADHVFVSARCGCTGWRRE